MNMLQLERYLNELASESKKDKALLEAVINVIMRYYCNVLSFYEEDAIEVFKHFLKTQTLDLKISTFKPKD